MVQITVKQIPWTDRLLKVDNQWGGKGKAAIMQGRIKFLNINGEKFDWDNDDLGDIEVVVKELKLIQPDFISEIPRIEVDSDYDKTIVPKPDEERDVKPSISERVAAARRNYGLETNVDVQVKTRGVNDEIEETPVDEIDNESDDE